MIGRSCRYNRVPSPNSGLDIGGSRFSKWLKGSKESWAGGKTPGGRFCNVFKFRNERIIGLHIYLDPDYTGSFLDFTANKIWTAQKMELLIKFENLYLT